MLQAKTRLEQMAPHSMSCKGLAPGAGLDLISFAQAGQPNRLTFAAGLGWRTVQICKPVWPAETKEINNCFLCKVSYEKDVTFLRSPEIMKKSEICAGKSDSR